MSLFGSMNMMRDFDEDPFFSSHREHMRRMDQMMGSFMNPFDGLFGDVGLPRLMGPPDSSVHSNGRRHHRQAGGGGGALMPFGFGHGMFPNIRDMFSGFEQMTNDPNCHSYSSSSVLTYTTGEDGAPKVYQASSSTRLAPGGVKETRKTESDSESGLKKMAIGHHLGEKAHIIERAQYGPAAQQEETQEFINLEEEEADTFNQEWVRKAQPQPQPYIYPALDSHVHRNRRPENEGLRALPAPSRKRECGGEGSGTEKSRRKSNDKPKNKVKHPKPETM